MTDDTGSVLEVTAGPAQGTRIVPGQDGLEIGRSGPGSGTLGGDPELSRRHARVSRLESGGLLVEDLGSSNGTFVNGARIGSPTMLRVGDELEVGGTALRAVAGPAAELTPGVATPSAPSPPERRPALRVVAGFAPGALIRLGEGGSTVGRAGTGSRALAGDPAVAEEHLRVTLMSDGRLMVEDLGSPDGTFLGEARIHSPTVVSTGDRLRLGGTTLEVVEAAAGGAADGGASKVLGGVRQVPEGLFARIGTRAPVTRQDVIPVLLLALGWAFAVNLLIRTLAFEVLDVSEDLHSLVLWQMLIATFCPVFFSSLGFYLTFRRPDDRSITRYMIPTLGLPLAFTVLALVRLDEWGAAEVAVTVLVTVLPVVITAPLMFRLRARVARERIGAVRKGGGA